MIAAVVIAAVFAAAPLGAPVAVLVRTYGPPAAVVSRDDGNRFSFAKPGTSAFDAWIDDDARVRALDVRGGSGDTFEVEIEGKPHAFAFGTYTASRADTDLAAVADTSAERVRTYRLDATRELVLAFDAADLLTRIVIGDRNAVARLGFLPGEQYAKTLPYVAPKSRASRVADGAGARVVVVREALDRRGDTTLVDLVIGSGDPAFDAAIVARARTDRWTPATLGGRAIGATVFREIRG